VRSRTNIHVTLMRVADPMIEVDDGTLKDTRMHSLEEGTSVNALLRGCLKGYAIGGGS
jgi:hypothetical protein